MASSKSLSLEYVYRFAGFRAALAQVELALNESQDQAIVVTGPRGVGVTTLLRHLTTFSGMGDSATRFRWNGEQGPDAEDSDWIIRDPRPGSRLSQPAATITPTDRFTGGFCQEPASPPKETISLPNTNSHAEVIVEMQPMTFEETLDYLDWSVTMTGPITPSASSKQTRSHARALHDRYHGCIGLMTRHWEQRKRRAA